jgi:hypothetical protein
VGVARELADAANGGDQAARPELHSRR